MALTYATHTDLEAAAQNLDVVPATAAETVRYIEHASMLVTQATRNDVYATTAAGLPDEQQVADAMRDATVEQTLFWLSNDVDPTKGAGAVRGTGEVESSSIGTGNIKLASANTTVVASRIASLERLVPAARLRLSEAGLGSMAPWVLQ